MPYNCVGHYLLTEEGNARLAGLEKDLGMKGNDYNAINSIFYVSYIVFGVPLNLICKLVGPGYFLPVVCIAFGLTSIGTAYVHSFSQLAGVRFLLGIFEAGVMPGITYYVVSRTWDMLRGKRI